MAPRMSREVPPAENSPEWLLLTYVEDCYMSDEPLKPEMINKFLEHAVKPLDWPLRHEDDMPIIHHVIMNDANHPEDAKAILTALLEFEANPQAVDSDGDNAMQTLIALAEDAERDGDGLEPNVKQLHLTLASVLVNDSKLVWSLDEALAVVSWLARFMPHCAERNSVRVALESHVGTDLVAKLWSSEQMFDYFERCAYSDKASLRPSKVTAFLEQGASPRHKRNGATCFLLGVLNPYSKLEDLVQVYDAMLRVDPEVATMRDGFGLTPVNWASSFRNLAEQHKMTVPNPASLLALMSCIVARVPAIMDSCESCFKVTPEGSSGKLKSKYLAEIPKPLRFLEGDRVVCRVEAPGNSCEWEEGVVIGLWYRETCFPRQHPGAPYEVKLDIGSRVYALVDDDRIIRRFVRFRPSARGGQGADTPVALAAPATAATATAGAAKNNASLSGRRFVRRQKDDGTWEMFDTVSGKARVIAAPDRDISDSD